MSDEVDDREHVPNEVLASGQLLCAGCGKKTEAARSVEEGIRPRLHDRTLCWTCGAVSIYERTSLGYWSLRAPTPEERAELDANESVRLARVEIADAKRHGRGPSSVGHEAGGAPPPGPPLVVVPAEPVDWEAFVERHGLDRGALHRLQEWTAANVPDRRIGPGSIELQCSACELPVRVGPTGQRAVFAVGAKVLCPACVHHLQRRMQEEEDR